MIHIIFPGGAHGNFLEFVCNKFFNVMDKALTNFIPFSSNNTSHNKTESYMKNREFVCSHYQYLGDKLYNENMYLLHDGHIIHVNIVPEDLLLLNRISLYRAGDYQYDDYHLEKNTYNKLNNVNYQWVLDNIIHNFIKNQIKNSYDNIKDPSWPVVNTMDDFNLLPQHIKDECITVHNIKLHELNKESPDCPRYILREFFKGGFKYPLQHGFLKQQEIVRKSKLYTKQNNKVFNFNFSSFYNIDDFMNNLQQLGKFIGTKLEITDELYHLHKQFLTPLKPYQESVKKCEDIISSVKTKQHMFMTDNLSLLEESYIDAKIEIALNIEMPTDNVTYFKTTNDIRSYIEEKNETI